MIRKGFFILFVLVMLVSLGGTGRVVAMQPLPTWQPVLDFVGPDPVYLGWSMETFNEHLYFTASRFDMALGRFTGADVARTADGQDWEVVLSGKDGDWDYFIAWDLAVFEGQLYITMNDWDYGYGKPAKIMRTADGVNWEEVFAGTPEVMKGNLIDKLGVFKGMIYATTTFNTGQIWRSPTGDPGTWEQVAELGTGIVSSSTLVSFKNYLYVGTSSSATGSSVANLWRSADGVTWEQVGQGVLDDPDNAVDRGLVQFKDALYFCLYNYVTGGRVYRSTDGLNWEMAAEPGFGDPLNNEFSNIIVYQGDLYVTANSTLPDFSNQVTVWRSHTGLPGSWHQVGDPILYAYSERGGIAVFKGGLYLLNEIPFNNNVTIYQLLE